MLLVGVLCVPWVIVGQEPDAEDASPDHSPRGEPTLFEQTLVQDIQSAGFYELVTWLDSLRLSTRGGREELAARLYQHYKLEPPAPREQPDEPRIIVDSAERSRYFTIDQTDERYIRLSGGVTVRLNDPEQDVVHNLSADQIVFNQEENEVTATGNVEYVLERDESTEKFSGAAVTIDLDDWQGSFLDGVTERTSTVDDQEIDFFFTGDYITRSAQDVVVMEDGTITSSTADPPNYQVTAQKIWVLAPGEWGLRGAVLRVGRVPLFYFPFFFKPGDELFFNPALGSRDREGTFIQTTTYLIGEPEEDDTALSFLRVADEQSDSRQLAIDGLYLREADEPVKQYPQGWSIKVMTDVYSALGAFLGARGAVSDLGVVSQLQFYGGVAVSRNIYAYSYSGQATTFSPFYLAEGTPRSVLNTTHIGPVELPVRLALDTTMRLQSNTLSGSVDFAYYSDPLFLRDFDNRSEQIDWLRFLGQGAGESTPPGEISSLDWRLTGTYGPRLPQLAPWLERFRIQEASASMLWRRRAIPSEELSPEIAAADNSPDASFFVPERVRFPTLNMALAGRLLTYPPPAQSAQPLQEPESELPAIREPWTKDEDSEPSADEPVLRVPGIRTDFSAPAQPGRTTASIGYSIVPSTTVEHVTPAEEWTTPDETELAFSYSAANLRGTASVDYALNVAGGIASFSGSLSGIGQYRGLFNRDESLADATWDSLQRQSYAFNSLATTNNLTVSVRPLRGVPVLAGSSVSYSLNLLLYQMLYDARDEDGNPLYRTESVGWDEDTFRNHQLSLSVALAVLDTQRLTLTAALPPRQGRVTGALNLAAGPVTAQFSTGVREDDQGEWTAEQLSTSQTLSLGDRFSLRNTLSYDLENGEFGSDTATVRYGRSQASLSAANTEGYTFGGPGVGWTRTEERQLRLTRAALSSSVVLEPEPWYRNRIQSTVTSNLSWEMNLLRFTENNLRFGLQGVLSVHDFLDLSLSVNSTNLETYSYIGALAGTVGRERESVLLDLAKSFNFFNRQDRVNSAFNLQRITLSATHRLQDWDLDISYSGLPELVTEDATPRYEWQAQFAATLQWRPIPELRAKFDVKDEQITIGD